MKEREFIARYGGIYEHSPWVAEKAAQLVDDSADVDVIARVMADCVDNASGERRLALIRAHPDLAGKAAIAGELTDASETEQSSAGLDSCSPDEYARFKADLFLVARFDAARRCATTPTGQKIELCLRSEVAHGSLDWAGSATSV